VSAVVRLSQYRSTAPTSNQTTTVDHDSDGRRYLGLLTGMTRDDLFAINAGIVASLIEGVAKHCPKVRSPSLTLPFGLPLSPSWVWLCESAPEIHRATPSKLSDADRNHILPAHSHDLKLEVAN
jgi:hypothetical protein